MEMTFNRSLSCRMDLRRWLQSLYDDPDLAAAMPRYDAILVDEGQDYRPIWWQALRNAVRPGGEMILVADKTQNIYATAATWTEDAMANAGFRWSLV